MIAQPEKADFYKLTATEGLALTFHMRCQRLQNRIHDLQATVLHLLGLDHERLTFRHAGRDFRLTDVSGQVVRSVLA